MNDLSGEDSAVDVAGGIGRTTSAVAAQGARVLADRLRERLEAIRGAKLEEAQRLGAIWDADRAAAGAQVEVAREISGVTDEDLRLTVEAWKTADGWAQVDPEFVDDERELRRQLQERWGVDVDRPDIRRCGPAWRARFTSTGWKMPLRPLRGHCRRCWS
ncbi:hypothetical protein H1W00_11465 [Aeromicrobium sp. Marseille-Q0843]|uniref:Uncharacterized protein n=1 Tax=Aeromicrobium phoceense TaxID=2754045 RepID=A0A838XKF5_9ACTN|nr:hypothetical protein [Aeromicrobium phoceense]MBA4609096.1 hypothetical protein [Aeromicrobium phoceense]